MSEKQERIVCAAVKFFVESISGDDDPYSEVLLCLNYDDEYAFEKRFELNGTGYYVASEEKRGFITNKNRFVDPVEARKIAVDAGQAPMITLTSYPPKIAPLKPEDLY